MNLSVVTDGPPPRPSIPDSIRGEPTWEMAAFYPCQGAWTVSEYLGLDGMRLIEFDRGVLEFLPMPTAGHQWLLGFLYGLFRDACSHHRRPCPLFAPVPVRITAERYREPDLLVPRVVPQRDHREIERPELVLEIISQDAKSRRRDLHEKPRDYATAGIPEYWIVDPEQETITVLTLAAGASEYTEHGVFRPGRQATSVLLDEFAVDVAACFAAGKGQA